MFSKDITGSDAFREMPPSSQALYFHLGMEADDDGFLGNYKGTMRSINASEDDLRILLAKRFLILFPSKVIVVKHWLLNNTVRKDRYTETKHTEEKRLLIVKENGAYTEANRTATIGIPNGNQMATQYRIEEDRIEEESGAKAPTPSQIAKSFFAGTEHYNSIFEEFAQKIPTDTLTRELNKFNLYWTEPNKSGTKVRWEQQSTFDVRRRLITWFSRSDFNRPTTSRGRGVEM